MIPKIIHYCWFGNSEFPLLVKQCISSWQKHLPNYQFIKWSEDNYSLQEPFVIDAYDNESWAFVVDYVRFDVLVKHGGIYLDTDMLLTKNLDQLLVNECFVGLQDDKLINGAIIGTLPNHEYIIACLNQYKSISFSITTEPLPNIMTKVLYSNIYDINVFPIDYFYPLPFLDRGNNIEDYKTINTYGVHLWNASWLDEWQLFNNGFKKEGLKKSLKKLKKNPFQSIKYYVRLIKAMLPNWLKFFLKKTFQYES